MGTGYTGGRRNCSLLIAEAMAVSAAQIWCFPGIPALLPLQDCKRSFQDNRRKHCKSGTAISPENESYFWSLYQTKQSLPASSRPAWKLLNTRDEDNRGFLPKPCSRMVLGGSPISRLFFSILLTLARDLHMRYLIPHSGAQLEQQQKLIFVNESKISSLPSSERAVSVVEASLLEGGAPAPRKFITAPRGEGELSVHVNISLLLFSCRRGV